MRYYLPKEEERSKRREILSLSIVIVVVCSVINSSIAARQQQTTIKMARWFRSEPMEYISRKSFLELFLAQQHRHFPSAAGIVTRLRPSRWAAQKHTLPSLPVSPALCPFFNCFTLAKLQSSSTRMPPTTVWRTSEGWASSSSPT